VGLGWMSFFLRSVQSKKPLEAESPSELTLDGSREQANRHFFGPSEPWHFLQDLGHQSIALADISYMQHVQRQMGRL
jgi:hypothetical protein